MNRTGKYYENVTSYRKNLTDIWADYEAGMKSIEPYKGSDGYAKKAAELEQARRSKIKETQADYRTRFNGIVAGMRMSAKGRSMDTPTQEQLALLTALKMRDKISRDELEQAGRTLKDSPVCLSVLDEIAERMEYRGMRFATESTNSILQSIDRLEDSARRICALDKPNSRREQAARASVHSTEWSHDALYSFHVDQDVATEEEAMAAFGGVGDYSSFAAAVNG